MNPYLSNETRNRAKMALEDLSTEQLLSAVRQSPVPDYRKKELDQSYEKDMREHRKVFQMEEKPEKLIAPRDPKDILRAMSYAKASNSPGMQSTGTGPTKTKLAPMMEGDPLGTMRIEKPKLEKNQLPVYNGFRIGQGSDSTDEGGGSNNAVT